ncbi:hypothetical protein RJG79_06510 [Mycoplasmatota bacterium WC44]
MSVLIIIVPILILVMMIITIPILRKKKVIKELLSNNKLNVSLSNEKIYDLVIEIEKRKYLVKVLVLPNNSVLQINSKKYWQLNSGYTNKPGSIPKNKRILTELSGFLKLEEEKKIIILYPGIRHIKKYINESEMKFVNNGELVHGIYVINYNELDSLIEINNI